MTGHALTPDAAASSVRDRTVAALAAAVRVAAGVLWLREGLLKYQAGFGGADIGLVVSSAAQNPRVPGPFKALTTEVLGRFPDAFAVLVPLLETGLGLALILGMLTWAAASASLAALASYWLADQLEWQYPTLLLLSAAALLGHRAAARFSLPSAVRWWRLKGRRRFHSA